jgi:hypothetical protein
MEFTNGATKVTDSAGTRTIKPAAGWPRVQILERSGREADSAWRVLETLTPLLSCASAHDANATTADRVQSCSLHVRVDPSTGTVAATQSKGPSVAQSWRRYFENALMVTIVLLPFILYGLWVGSTRLYAWYEARQEMAWLMDFYMKNAPEVRLRTSQCRFGDMHSASLHVHCSHVTTSYRCTRH